MAGIGFSLRKILNHDSLARAMAAYTVAGIISGGPWLVSILGILILALLVSIIPEYHQAIAQFKVSVTYLTASSLILSGFAGNSFCRYVADQLFLNKIASVIGNLSGMILLISAVTGCLSFLFVLLFFPEQSILYRFLFMGSFVVLCNIWVVISLLTGLKDYKLILAAFFSGYGITVAMGYLLRDFGLDAYMLAYFIGQIVLIVILLIALYRQHPTDLPITFHFLKKNKMSNILILSGFFFNFGIWVDKFVFWFSPETSYAVIGPLRASALYDLPIFIAYLFSLPGMAVFLLLMETNFADYYLRYHEAIRRGKSLSYIKMTGEQMVNYAMNVIYSIVKIQAITIIIVFQFGKNILALLNISVLHDHLSFIAIIGTSLQVVFLSIINILYYMDKLQDAMVLSVLFFILNLLLTLISLYLGPLYYGLGFTCALMVTCVYGIYMINDEFTDLEYKSIMMR